MARFSKSCWFDDWYVLAEGMVGQPEGTRDEWEEIVKAMREKRHQRFRRVGVYFKNDFACVYSPRNAIDDSDHYPIHPLSIEEFCQEVEAELAKYDERVSQGAGI